MIYLKLVLSLIYVTVIQVEQIVDIGEIDPGQSSNVEKFYFIPNSNFFFKDRVDVPGIYIDRLIQGVNYEKRIEVSNKSNFIIQIKLFFAYLQEFNV